MKDSDMVEQNEQTCEGELDGCFMKRLVTSKFLAAIGRDANNQIFP